MGDVISPAVTRVGACRVEATEAKVVVERPTRTIPVAEAVDHACAVAFNLSVGQDNCGFQTDIANSSSSSCNNHHFASDI